MTSWVLAISKKFPEHWEIAKKHGLWDLLTPRRIETGDVVYFWLSERSLVGRVVVTEGARPLQDGEHVPWLDAGEAPYLQRFRFTNVMEPREQPRWTDVKARTGLRAGPNFAPRSDDPRVERGLDSFFGELPTQDVVEINYPNADDALVAISQLTQDERDVAYAAIKLRRGQTGFRNALLAAYGRCAVTGSDVPSVLEAAHISPYRGAQTNHVQNGLLLRADIHSLFDLHALTLQHEDGGLVVRLNEALLRSDYADLDGRPARLPTDPTLHPARQVLEQHNAQCAWL